MAAPNHPGELSGKVALVTGASRNIGRSIALALAAGGAAVAVNARASKEDADKVVQEIRAAGGQAETFLADIVDPKAVNAMVEGVAKRFGRLDVLVLNASVRKETPFRDMSFDEWRSLLSIEHRSRRGPRRAPGRLDGAARAPRRARENRQHRALPVLARRRDDQRAADLRGRGTAAVLGQAPAN